MSCLSTERRAQLQEQLDKVTARLTAAYAAVEAAYDNVEVEEYSFNSGEGQQRTRRRDPEKLESLIAQLERRQDWLRRKLGQGGGIVNVNLRRKGYGYGRYYGTVR